MLKDIEDKKEQQAKSREEALQKKKDAQEAFLKCKSQCLCQQPKCLAIGLKQCPVCQNISCLPSLTATKKSAKYIVRNQ